MRDYATGATTSQIVCLDTTEKYLPGKSDLKHLIPKYLNIQIKVFTAMNSSEQPHLWSTSVISFESLEFSVVRDKVCMDNDA